ncbi:MAG TPA: ADP-ribosylglycohydrolase family protein [Acidobacteriota bacterium]|nr:ADP-ribosylglycohydrolase family protein [Acidobacteriota bacterium]
MIGAIVGDIVGSAHEFLAPKHTAFPLFDEKSTFTDDTVLSVAVADCILSGASYVDKLHEYTRAHPLRGYGLRFTEWVQTASREPYNSWGNGSAMRVSPVGFAFDTLEDTLDEAKRSAEVTHNHPEEIKGAQATATAIFLARQGESKKQIRKAVTKKFDYDLSRTVEEIRPNYSFNESCQETVPESIVAFLDSTDYEDAIRLAISLGGDADTLACITGGIAHAFYGGVPSEIAKPALDLLDAGLLRVVRAFCVRFDITIPS